MSRQKTSVYRNFIRSSVKEPDLKPRALSPEQILSLRYQCAVENKDFETAKALKALMNPRSASATPPDKKTDISVARQQAEQLFRKDNRNDE